ncbi:MAG: hypothetical protein BWX70_02242 [Verrucomicrobia bacterium ADurb.Bin070]|nr:MAG: hypothetical protein BWX70_02242 [Verrucomicrobia bacterium ADurb.Bin070]
MIRDQGRGYGRDVRILQRAALEVHQQDALAVEEIPHSQRPFAEVDDTGCGVAVLTDLEFASRLKVSAAQQVQLAATAVEAEVAIIVVRDLRLADAAAGHDGDGPVAEAADMDKVREGRRAAGETCGSDAAPARVQARAGQRAAVDGKVAVAARAVADAEGLAVWSGRVADEGAAVEMERAAPADAEVGRALHGRAGRQPQDAVFDGKRTGQRVAAGVGERAVPAFRKGCLSAVCVVARKDPGAVVLFHEFGVAGAAVDEVADDRRRVG